ncbi:kinocilin isoform X2 [Alosa sapidissima]|uniref:kinocilin isoform X2 n=1 Tax=Alosa sapidissima TaxID=34773 RepID=UPI001C08374D|nr:kinocilin isoform X2 [Alosa sapidissima]
MKWRAMLSVEKWLPNCDTEIESHIQLNDPRRLWQGLKTISDFDSKSITSGGGSTCWMNAVSIGEYHGLRVGSALLSIVAGCIIIGVSKDCDADAVGGIFLGAGGLGLLISVYPFIRAWFNFHHILPTVGNFRVHPMPSNPVLEQAVETIRREGTQSQLNLERSKSRIGTCVDSGTVPDALPEDGPSSDVPDILARRKIKPTLSDPDIP